MSKYNKIISKQEKEGIIETVEDPKVTVLDKTYYIPHREVVREDRVAMKTCTVFDASTRRKGPSLNEFLEAGPCLLPKVFDILLRCRAYKILLMSDTQSAFLKIHIAEKDRDFPRFLWIDGIVNSLLFGLNCAIFIGWYNWSSYEKIL